MLLCQKGKIADALSIHNNLFKLTELLFCETNPCPLKAAMEVLGLCGNHFRLPLAPISEENYIKVSNTLKETKIEMENFVREI